ncbi:transposase [Patulibacter sp. S7RM1-6]
MAKQQRYPAEAKQRAVGLVLEHQADHPSRWKAIAGKLDINAQTLSNWVKQARIDQEILGVTSDEQRRSRELEREHLELRRSNEILKAALAFLARELDPQLKE